ncbi:MAG: outer membrane protein assembly factor BamE [Pseudomonadota bacterium]
MRTFMLIFAILIGAGLSACAPQFRNHGYIPPEEDLQELVVGIDTRATVEDVAGSPTAGGVLEGGNFYYVSSVVRTSGARQPKVVDRQVLAISFDADGVLQNIERFGLEAGRVVVLQRRVTENGITNISFLRQLLGNIGQFDPAGAFGG